MGVGALIQMPVRVQNRDSVWKKKKTWIRWFVTERTVGFNGEEP
jgi:hypothetical protein